MKTAVNDSALVYTECTKKLLFHGVTETSPGSSHQELWLLLLCMMDLALTVNTEDPPGFVQPIGR